MSGGAEREATGPRALGEILTQLSTLRGYGRRQGSRQLAEMWQRAAGAEIAARTKVLSLRSGTLHVGVASSALLGELAAFHRPRLLEALRSQNFGSRIRDLKFRLRAP